MKCRLCSKITKDLYPIYETNTQITYLICKQCNNPYKEKEEQERKEKTRNYTRTYRKKYYKKHGYPIPDYKNPKVKARQKLRSQVYRGKIVKPSQCERCESTTDLDGHHTDYNKPFEVEWICRD